MHGDAKHTVLPHITRVWIGGRKCRTHNCPPPSLLRRARPWMGGLARVPVSWGIPEPLASGAGPFGLMLPNLCLEAQCSVIHKAAGGQSAQRSKKEMENRRNGTDKRK